MSHSSGKRIILAAFLTALFLTACQNRAVRDVSLRVELSPTLKYLSPAIQACALQSNGLHIILEEKPAGEMGKTGANVSLIWGDRQIPAQVQVFRLGSDRLVLAAHKENPLIYLNHNQATLLYRAGYTTWGEALKQLCSDCTASDSYLTQPVEVWHYPKGEDISSLLLEFVPEIKSSNLGQVWIAPAAENLASAITNNPAAVGFLPARWLNENLKEISLIGSDPSSQDIPVLAVTPGLPLEVTQSWLHCLQSTFNN